VPGERLSRKGKTGAVCENIV